LHQESLVTLKQIVKKPVSNNPTPVSPDDDSLGLDFLPRMYGLKLAALNIAIPLSSLKWILHTHAAEFPPRYNLYTTGPGAHSRMLTADECWRIREIAFGDRQRTRRTPMDKVTKALGVVIGEATQEQHAGKVKPPSPSTENPAQ
jgi:hypothetical protein